jgi:tetratricopeptide (TPR) repeat protein
MGFVHTNQPDSAQAELNSMQRLHDTLLAQQETYEANQVAIQLTISQAWILWKEGKNAAALESMIRAADMEDKTEKHPVTPGEILPARELLADMYMQMHQPQKALEAYEADLTKHPNRYNALYGAAQAALQCGKKEQAATLHNQLAVITGNKAP